MKTVTVMKIGNLKDPDPTKRGQIGIMDFPEQKLGEEDVRIKVAYCAICGSDPHLAEGVFGWEPPFGIGHEMSGIVVELGKKATRKGLKIGDHIAGNFMRYCGTCYYCQNGQPHFCLYGEDSNKPCMSENVVWHESQVYQLPNNISLKKGCLLEPITIAVRMVDKSNLKIGQRVLVCGGGPIGLLGLQLLKRSGATSLTLIEPVAQRRELGRKYGADFILDPTTKDIQDEAMRITQGLGYDIVINASGAPAAVSVLPEITARGGMLIFSAMYPNTFQLPFNLYEYCYFKELTTTGFFCAPHTYPRAVNLIPSLDLDDFTSTVFPIDQAENAFFEHLSSRHPKVLIQCNDNIGN